MQANEGAAPPDRPLDFQAVFSIDRAGNLRVLADDFHKPNGLAFSPDEKTLYVAQSDPNAALWMAFPIKDDGTFGTGKVFKDVTDMVRLNDILRLT